MLRCFLLHFEMILSTASSLLQAFLPPFQRHLKMDSLYGYVIKRFIRQYHRPLMQRQSQKAKERKARERKERKKWRRRRRRRRTSASDSVYAIFIAVFPIEMWQPV